MRLQLQGPLGERPRVWERLARVGEHVRQHQVVEGVHREGVRVVGLERERALETHEGPLGSLGRELGEVMTTLEQRLEGRDVRSLPPGRLARAQAEVELLHDRGGDLVLDLEHVDELAVEALAPDVRIVGDVDELRRDPQPLARLADAALEHGAYPQRLAHPAQVLLATEAERRGTRDHPQIREPGQRVDDLFGQPVAEVVVLAVGAHVDERQHRDRSGARVPSTGSLGGADPRFQRRTGLSGGLESASWILAKATLDEPAQRVGEVATDRRGRGRLVPQDGGYQAGGVVGLERTPPRRHLVEQHAHREDVAAVVDRAALDLRRHVGHGSHHDTLGRLEGRRELRVQTLIGPLVGELGARPKSSTFTRPESATMTFAGFRSR